MTDPLNCPMPLPSASVELAHGAGGLKSRQLLEEIILPSFANAALEERHDGAVVPGVAETIAFTTDSYVVDPLFFPGGDIGCLAVWGTVNDLAMCGARPLALSIGLILEEGLPLDELRRVVASMQDAASAVGVPLVTGDTKVVDRGKCDRLFVNTSGVGAVQSTEPIRPTSVRPGDALIVSGDLGRHGIAVLSAREGLTLEGVLESDVGPLWGPVEALLGAGIEVHCLRDLTRGGFASALNEIAEVSGTTVRVRERDIPVAESVRGACELLGLDPLYVACEGRFLVVLPSAQAEQAVRILHTFDISAAALVAGEILPGDRGEVVLETRLGSLRPVDLLVGEQLPRIC